ncbi:DEAD/DEAH box helicase [uncultured Treponema sp.]|uniref:DEAD/DEAH box helicase n=1 Tax=uncultured Treponema sp. TaxID=162155 RepID=UPI002590459F|nr:DEAD/DEAH box helicase [uncultured Treponema sp.]
MKFTEFSLHESLLQGIEGAGYVDCTPVQEQVLKSSLEGRDLYVQSQTGTGKTAAYLTSVIQELLTRGESAGKKALVMVPTRELAVQVQEEAQKLAKFTSLKCASFYGGVGYDKQVASLKKGVDIMIGTPGRVIDLNHGNQMDLSSVAFLVIDEADRMFDMGFYPDLRTLIKVLPSSEQRQTMLFSATLNSYVKNLAWEYTRNPAEITIAAENITVDEIAQELFHVSSDDKMKLLLGIISREKPESLIVFCNTKKSCEIVAKRLGMNGFESEFIIGDLPQKKRLAIMDKFKAGAIKCLVATDVAARGIDVNDLAMVINYDLPNEAENYVHRIGRTARAGKSGKAFTFCSEQDVYSLPPIERYIEKSIPSCVADESMFAEDKSAGVYIKLDSYHEDYNDKSEFGRRRAAEYNRKNGNSDRRRSSKKGSGRYSSRNEEAKKEYKRDRRVYIDEDKLASMSTEERMKIYKEKYASFASGSSSNKQKISTKKQGVAKKNSSVQKNASGKKNYSSKSAESKKTPQKKSVFARIKSFFGKK